MKKSLSERLIAYAKKHPNGFTVKIENGKLRTYKGSTRKNFVVVKTDNDTIRKIKTSFRNNNYSGYVNGFIDDNGNININKQEFTNTKKKAIKKALRYNSLTIFDIQKAKEIQIQSHKGEYREKQKERAIKKAQSLQEKTTSLPVVKRKKGWYNTLTKRYVSESYGKRINNYFLKNPESTLYRATGHGKYSRKKTISELPKDVSEILYGKGNQFIKTKDVTGKTVYFAPVHNEVLTDEQIKNLKELDYPIAGKKAYVELYRLTRDRRNIYHLITWDIKQKIPHPDMIDIWLIDGLRVYGKIERELKKIVKKHNLGSTQNLYAHISTYFYTDLDGWSNGKTFGFVIPNQSGFKLLKKEFLEIMEWYKNKLEINAYHNVYIDKITFYVWNNKGYTSKAQQEISKYRLGVNRMMS